MAGKTYVRGSRYLSVGPTGLRAACTRENCFFLAVEFHMGHFVDVE